MTLPAMPPLPPSGDTTWYDYATALHNVVEAIRNTYETALHRLMYDGTYPARPVDAPAGTEEYVGPTAPTDGVDGDTWIQATVV